MCYLLIYCGMCYLVFICIYVYNMWKGKDIIDEEPKVKIMFFSFCFILRRAKVRRNHEKAKTLPEFYAKRHWFNN